MTVGDVVTLDVITDLLKDETAVMNSVPTAAFKNGNQRNAITQEIQVLMKLVEQGNYADAIDKLERDILKKMDGCVVASGPDAIDWITDCTAQGQVYLSLAEATEWLLFLW